MLYSIKKNIENSVPVKVYNQNNETQKRTSLIECTPRITHKEQFLDDYIQHKDQRSCLLDSALSSMSSEERICLYQKKYTNVIEAENPLKAWIKLNQEKGPPPELKDEYVSLFPYQSPSASASCTKNKRSLIMHSTREHDVTSPSPKKSFSTFLKKTMRSSNSPLSKQKSKSRSQPTNMSDICYQDCASKVTGPSSTTKNFRFSLSSSLNRLSSAKRSDSDSHDFTNSKLEIDADDPSIIDDLSSNNGYQNLPAIIEYSKHYGHLNPQRRLDNMKRPQSAYVTSSSQSVFLNSLHRQSIYEEKTYVSSEADDTIDPEYDFVQDKTNDKKTFTNRDLFSPWNSQRRKNLGTNDSTKKEMESIFQDEKHASINLDEAKRKNRMSFSFGPSLSNIRFIPQRSHILKRQSMLA